jgi:pilus assembly protein FimV
MHTNLNSITQADLAMPGKTWRLTALAAALGTLLSVVHVNANALALGRIASLSSLGEPLVASIDIPDIKDEERTSLKASLASAEAFRIAGMEYNPALASAQITLMQRDNGSSYLLLRSDKVVTDPFINLVVNASWATGRVVRNYTLLLDPPAAKQSEAAAVSAPITVLPAPPAVVTPSPAVTAPATTTPVTVSPAITAPARAAPAVVSQAPAAVAMPKAATSTKPSDEISKAPAKNSGDQIKVGNGDTAGKIASNNLPGNVSLEQMLVAMLRGNPQAFIGNNVNRLKAGVILDLPTEAEASAITAKEAKQNLIAQSKDFNSFRRKLAESAPALATKSTDRVASGKIEAKVEDQKVVTPTPDKLTLSKGGLTAGDKSAAAAKENLEKIAKERQAKDDAARSAELAKNIKELNKIASTTAAVAAPATAVTAATTATVTPDKAVNPVSPTAPGVAVAAAAPVAVTAPSSNVVSPAAASPAAPKPPVVTQAPVVATPVAETSALDFLTDDPLVLPAAGGALALLLLGGLYANNKRKKSVAADAAEDDALHEDNFDERSFFKETINEPIIEGQEPTLEVAEPVLEEIEPVVTSEAPKNIPPIQAVNSHAVVDPITEADVYLDYGRDVQAEEILKDGLKKQPENTAIYTKLLDIYAKRRDVKNFELTALKAKLLLPENDSQWHAISKQGFELEPSNTLYRAAAPLADDPFATISNAEFSTRTVAQLDPESAKSPASVDLDLDFNFASAFPASAAKPVEPPKTPLVDFPDFSLEPTTKTSASDASVPTASAPKVTEFDLDSLSLDLNKSEPKVTSPTTSNDNSGPLETKLALAQEFHAIGDKIGAKMLVNEVLSSASDALKLRAEALLAEIG